MPRILTCGGLALALLGAALWLWSGLLLREDWSPCEMPIQLRHGEAVTSSFTTDRSGTYWVMLRVPRDIPFDELVRVLGKSWGLGDFSEDQGEQEPILIPWEVRSRGVVVASQPGRGNQGRCSSSAGEAGVSLGSFEAGRGRPYVVSARVEQTVEPLLGHATELAVEADPMLFKNAFVSAFVLSACAFFAALAGLVLLAVGLVLGRVRRRVPRTPPEAFA